MWQNGPEVLKWPVKDWPKKSAGDVVAHARESVNKLLRKVFFVAGTTNLVKGDQHLSNVQRSSDSHHLATDKSHATTIVDPCLESAQKSFVEAKRFSSLRKLVSVVAWVLQAVETWLRIRQENKEQVKLKSPTLTVKERRNALNHLFLEAQAGEGFPSTVLNRLLEFKDKVTGLLVCGRRSQVFAEDKSAVPLMPYGAWISKSFLNKLNSAELEHEAVKHGTDWSWKIHPADSPHWNGAAEAAVRFVKRALNNIGGTGASTWRV